MMNTHAIVFFKDTLINDVFVDAYSIFSLDEWNEMKVSIGQYDKDFDLLVGKHKSMGNNKLPYICGAEFLSKCSVTEITQNEYDAFTNIMPTYFGEEEIFQDVMDIVEA